MGAILTGWLPRPQLQPYWNDLIDLLAMAAARGNVPAWQVGDLMWIAIDGGQVIGAASTRLLSDGRAELKHVAGTRVREWYPDLEDKICAWAANSGASVIVAEGRRGWVPLVARLGWKVAGSSDGRTLFEKVL